MTFRVHYYMTPPHTHDGYRHPGSTYMSMEAATIQIGLFVRAQIQQAKIQRGNAQELSTKYTNGKGLVIENASKTHCRYSECNNMHVHIHGCMHTQKLYY